MVFRIGWPIFNDEFIACSAVRGVPILAPRGKACNEPDGFKFVECDSHGCGIDTQECCDLRE
jgi:hypothetical protein